MSITTRSGDRGTASLYGGRRVRKDNMRFGAIGSVDELNSHLGLTISLLPNSPSFRPFVKIISRVQQDLFEVGSELATPSSKKPPFRVGTNKVKQLEFWIDEFEGKLSWSGKFILPGGHTAASQAHVARTVARRAERDAVALSRKQKLNPELLRYLNRLSDLIFIVARTINKKARKTEMVWAGKKT